MVAVFSTKDAAHNGSPVPSSADASPREYRDELVRRFEEATLAFPEPRVVPLPRGVFHAQAVHIVREALAAAGSSFDNPTWDSLERATAKAKEDARDLGVGPSVVQEEWAALERLLARSRPPA